MTVAVELDQHLSRFGIDRTDEAKVAVVDVLVVVVLDLHHLVAQRHQVRAAPPAPPAAAPATATCASNVKSEAAGMDCPSVAAVSYGNRAEVAEPAGHVVQHALGEAASDTAGEGEHTFRALLQALAAQSDATPYARYNLGVALLRGGDAPQRKGQDAQQFHAKSHHPVHRKQW